MIPVTLLEFLIEGRHDLDLGANPGSSLRGSLYEALAVMYDTGETPCSRYDLDTNPVAWLLRLEDESTSGGREVPRPIALRPPLTVTGKRAAFGISFYGRGQETISMVLSAVTAMQTIGVGRNRRSFRLRQVRAVDPLSRQHQLLIEENTTIANSKTFQAPSLATYERFAALLDASSLTVRFLTPTRIVENGKLCHQPVFRSWVQRLLERTRLVSELYSQPVWIPFHDLLAIAGQVQLVEDHTRWQDAWSYSRYDGTRKPTGGFVGEARYEGELAPLLPYLLLGQSLQVGKNTVKGCGWYEMVYQWNR